MRIIVKSIKKITLSGNFLVTRVITVTFFAIYCRKETVKRYNIKKWMCLIETVHSQAVFFKKIFSNQSLTENELSTTLKKRIKYTFIIKLCKEY
jgi:hypothetical protein